MGTKIKNGFQFQKYQYCKGSWGHKQELSKNKLFIGQLRMPSLQQCMQPNVSLIMSTENIQSVYALQHTECICSLEHSTNQLPPIPSASDSISAAKPVNKTPIS